MDDETGKKDVAIATLDEHHQEKKETGWDRIKQAYTADPETHEIPRELYELILMTTMGMLMGYAYGGVPASRHARDRYIQKSGAAIYSSRLEATGASYNAGVRGFIRYGYRWGWRIAFLAAGFQGISTCMSLYRDKQDITNYVSAAMVTGSLYRFNLGLRGLVGGAFAGAVVGIPAGLILMGAQKLQGETTLEKNKRVRQEKAIARDKELLLRRDVTPLMMEYMEENMNPRSDSEKNETASS
ncbi:complex I assembly factor TIMMDC1, mitochondrial-like isoform X2 [Patiria miniata]|nr:complex I assembly factor TIMMDC1, mitochondrial-like isoform X2 [Patiria miniata]XP_038069562.1 complex I assembly factor TIMMDC1, mitochondrial-like isoform X2 [Patiria miniata]XP_038069563.1 complex I assembly factor TIMMDC1, mitochondrial-like isoform X2 [Patiria miniata]XP_038069564.1 complex I assembly factor TIMMDC1, mitochondrial-like isoform X2 [Patiria miniata]XP_038069565.1 complex I assembly factor TIMMDC1, mitochondrial-like isoform X2 [Patiria miniata]XP_038069566.1 complex I 